MDEERFAEFWRELKEAGARTEWSCNVKTSQGDMFLVLFRFRHENDAIGGKLAVIGGVDGGEISRNHGLWVLDIDRKQLSDFESSILEYNDIKVFAREFYQVLESFPTSIQVEKRETHLKIWFDFTPFQDYQGVFNIDAPVQDNLSSVLLLTLSPFFAQDIPVDTNQKEQDIVEKKPMANIVKRRRKRNEIF